MSVRYMCASFATNLVHGCTRYVGSDSAMAYLRNRLSRIVLYHHAWVVGDVNVRSEVVRGLKGGIIKVLCIAVSSDVNTDTTTTYAAMAFARMPLSLLTLLLQIIPT